MTNNKNKKKKSNSGSNPNSPVKSPGSADSKEEIEPSDIVGETKIQELKDQEEDLKK